MLFLHSNILIDRTTYVHGQNLQTVSPPSSFVRCIGAGIANLSVKLLLGNRYNTQCRWPRAVPVYKCTGPYNMNILQFNFSGWTNIYVNKFHYFNKIFFWHMANILVSMVCFLKPLPVEVSVSRHWGDVTMDFLSMFSTDKSKQDSFLCSCCQCTGLVHFLSICKACTGLVYSEV